MNHETQVAKLRTLYDSHEQIASYLLHAEAIEE
jgi:hypothetical protein